MSIIETFQNERGTLAFGGAAFGLQANLTTLSKLDMIANTTSVVGSHWVIRHFKLRHVPVILITDWIHTKIVLPNERRDSAWHRSLLYLYLLAIAYRRIADAVI
jgi:hypothetical protein